ncbi:MAG: hypothetical protein ACSHW0_01605 [Thalassotalea sp.]
MDSLTDLFNLTQVASSAKAKQDKKPKQFYRQTHQQGLSKPNKQIEVAEELSDSAQDRRSGEDRRLTSKDRHRRFEYRYSKDRRRSKNIFVKV